MGKSTASNCLHMKRGNSRTRVMPGIFYDYTYPQDVRLSKRVHRHPRSPPEWVQDRTPKTSCPTFPADNFDEPSQELSVERSDGPFADWLKLVPRNTSKNYLLGHLMCV